MSGPWDRPLHPENFIEIEDEPDNWGDDEDWNPDYEDGHSSNVFPIHAGPGPGDARVTANDRAETDVHPISEDAAFVFFVAFGADPDEIDVSTERHRVEDVPEELEIALTGRDTVLGFFAPPIGDLLREDSPDLVELASSVGTCIIISGGFEDPLDLEYLRNSIGVATAMVDAGAVAIYNLQNFTLFSANEWRREIFKPDRPPTEAFVRVLWSDESDEHETNDEAEHLGERPATVWVHTRGLRTFGRPDLSVRGVPVKDRERAGKFCSLVADQLVRGLDIADGAQMDIGVGLGAVTFSRGGDINDPDFNNVHLEVHWPSN